MIVGIGRFKWLHRIGHERVADRPGPTVGVRWTKGKGIIGECWETGRDLCVDTGSFDALHGNDSEAIWNRVPEAERRRLTHAEYKRIAGKYGTVIAVPMFNGDEQLIGVVALDSPGGSHVDLSSGGVMEQVASTANLISQLIS